MRNRKCWSLTFLHKILMNVSDYKLFASFDDNDENSE